MNHNGLTGSIVSYPNRGNWGDASYRGNCTGHIISYLIDFYKPKQFVEVFSGGGTGNDVCVDKGIANSLHLDLRPEFGAWNALTDDMPVGADLVFSHPFIMIWSFIRVICGEKPIPMIYLDARVMMSSSASLTL